MIMLYHAPGSCSLAVKAALALTGLEHKIQTVNLSTGEHLTPEFKRVSPLAKVPAIDIDGWSLSEGAAILLYLAERAPEANLLPPQGTLERVEAYRWLMFLYTNVHPAFARAFVPASYGNDQTDIQRKAEANLISLFEVIEQQLAKHDYIAGDALTLPDLYLIVTIHWQRVLSQKLTDRYEKLAAYMVRMLNEPIIGQLYQSELSVKEAA
jgi:glutathione S-transferase